MDADCRLAATKRGGCSAPRLLLGDCEYGCIRGEKFPDGTAIIVVEKSTLICRLVTEIFEEMGATCEAFHSLDAAWIQLYKLGGQPSLIIVDQGVPGTILGLEFLCAVKNKWPALPAILTASVNR